MKKLILLITLFSLCFSKSFADIIHGDQDIIGVIRTQSNSEGSHPCPDMTDTEMLAVPIPGSGDCVHNLTLNNWMVYNGSLSAWEELGSGGGLSDWLTATNYKSGDIVIESYKIYLCLSDHTSGTFSTDLASGDWVRINDEFNAKSENGSSLPIREIQVPNSQLTQTDTDKARIETGNGNILTNPSFEHQVANTGFICSDTGSAVSSVVEELTTKFDGKKSLKITCDGTAGAGTCNCVQSSSLYQDQYALGGVQGEASIWVNTSWPKVYFYGLQAGSRVNADNSITVPAKSSWVPVSYPFTLGGTDNGYQVSIEVASAETAITYVDNAKLKAKEVVTYTPNSGEWTDGVCTSSWTTNTTVTCKYRQEGPDAVIHYYWILSGSPSATNLKFSIPDGLTVDLSLIDVDVIRFQSGSLADTGSTAFPTYAAFAKSDPSNVIIQSVISSSTSNIANVTNSSPFAWGSGDFGDAEVRIPVKEFSATSSYYSTKADYFSTSENTLTFKSIAIVDSDPVGTYNTYRYATASDNTRTICATAPTTAPTKTDGFLIYTRVYTATSTCNSPVRVEIKVAQAGTSLPTMSRMIFKNAGKSISGMLDAFINSSTIYGARINAYDEETGLLIVDFGYGTGGITSSVITFSDASSTATSGYLVIDAQPAKSTAVADLSSLKYVYLKATSNDGAAIGTSLTDIVFEDVDPNSTSNAYDASTGVFTVPKGKHGLYSIRGSVLTGSVALATNERFTCQVLLNGSVIFNGTRANGNGTGQLWSSDWGQDVYLSDDDQIKVQCVSAVATTKNASGLTTFLTITRIPGDF